MPDEKRRSDPAAEGPNGWLATAPPSRTEWVVDQLRNAIVFGDIRPGESLFVEELARRWGVSVTPVREALQRLSAEGLVEQTAHRSAAVRPVSVAELDDIYALRLLLEPMALERSVARGDESWAEELRRAFERLDSWYAGRRGDLVVGREEVTEYERAHLAFHRHLVSECGSPWLLRFVDILRIYSHRYRFLSWPGRGGAEAARKEHRELVEAALARDAARSVELIQQHIRRTYDLVRPIVQRMFEGG